MFQSRFVYITPQGASVSGAEIYRRIFVTVVIAVGIGLIIFEFSRLYGKHISIDLYTPAQKHVTFGAVAISTGTMGGGPSWGYWTARNAEIRAVAECRIWTGQDDCVSQIVFRDECAAVATSKPEKASAAAHGQRKADVEIAALDQCVRVGGKSCTIAVSACTPTKP
jgi:hypothetical protein